MDTTAPDLVCVFLSDMIEDILWSIENGNSRKKSYQTYTRAVKTAGTLRVVIAFINNVLILNSALWRVEFKPFSLSVITRDVSITYAGNNESLAEIENKCGITIDSTDLIKIVQHLKY